MPICDLTDCSLKDFSVHGISQASMLEWVAMSFSSLSTFFRQWGERFLIHTWKLFQEHLHYAYSLESESHSVMSNSLQPHRLYSPWNSLGQNTGVGSLSILQGIFPTQESNWGLLCCRRILYQLSYQGSPFHYLSGKHIPLLKHYWLACHCRL